MWRLLKLCVGLVAFVAIAWFGATVDLGSRTLFGHLRAIGQTRESQELFDGTRQAAEPLVDGVKRRVAGHAAPAAAPDAGAPRERETQETITPEDQRKLRRVIGSAAHATAQR